MLSREIIAGTIKKEKIVSILRGVPRDKLIKTIEAIHKGGVSSVEITLNHTSNESYAESLACISMAREYFGDSCILGAGTVISEDDVINASNAGACFIVSPNTDERAIKKTRELNMVSLPGAYTPSEICNAYTWGADFVKVFPLNKENAVSYMTALNGPLAHIPKLAVSGVDLTNLEDVMKAGAVGVGIGKNIAGGFVKDYVSDEDFEKITSSAKQYTQILSKL